MSGLGDPFESERWDDDPSPISADLLLRTWLNVVRAEEPWCGMTVDDRSGELRRLVTELLDLTADLESPARRRRIRAAAALHGAYRGAQRSPRATVDADFATLRCALRQLLGLQGAPRSIVRDVVRVLLPDWQLARRVARVAHAEARGAID